MVGGKREVERKLKFAGRQPCMGFDCKAGTWKRKE